MVYGRPAIALPLPALRTVADARPHHGRFQIRATDINHVVYMPAAPLQTLKRPHPLALLAGLTFERLQIRPPRAVVTIRSDIPVGSNLGSGAAVSIALARVLAAFAGRSLDADSISELAYAVEKLHHGSPSGIDNTVIAYEQAVQFTRGQAVERISLANPPHLVIGDTGESTPTRIPVGDVRAAWEQDQSTLERTFDAIAAQVAIAHDALTHGAWAELGAALNTNHALLRTLTVSSERLDALCEAALRAGALGAKMSGGGRGGNMLALAHDTAHAHEIAAALRLAGARRATVA